MFVNSTIKRSGALPRQPTAALPGSEEKIRVMIERAARRERLFHPLDGPGYKGPPPAAAEETEDWPFTLIDDALEQPAPVSVDAFEEDGEAITTGEVPAYCSWIAAASLVELPAASVGNLDNRSLPAGSPG